MRTALLSTTVGIMVLVPFSTAFVLAVSPHKMRLIPVWFWVGWFLVSVWATLEAPMRAGWFSERPDQAVRYCRVGTVLAMGNVLWSIAAVIYLGWWM